MQELTIGAPSIGAVDTLESSTIRRVTWRFIPLLALGYIVSMIDRVNVGFAAITANRDLHLSPSAYGFGAGIAFIGYILFGFPSNQILARVGARFWLACIMIVWGLISACTAYVVGPVSFFVVRFLLGVAEAGYFPGILLFMSLWLPRKYRARYLALLLIGMPLSALIGAPLSALLLHREGMLGLHGWQWLYIVEALPAVLLGIAVRFVLTDRPSDAHWLAREQREWLIKELAAEPVSAHHGDITFLGTLFDRRILFYSLIFFNVTAASFGLVFWLPQIIHASGLSPEQSNYLTAIPYVIWDNRNGRMGAFFRLDWRQDLDSRFSQRFSWTRPHTIGDDAHAGSAALRHMRGDHRDLCAQRAEYGAGDGKLRGTRGSGRDCNSVCSGWPIRVCAACDCWMDPSNQWQLHRRTLISCPSVFPRCCTNASHTVV